jgi:RHS repeat-associated protein
MVPEKARSEIFRYDAAGNLHESGEGAEPRIYGVGSRLLQKGSTEYRWSDAGRLIEKRTRTPMSEDDEVWHYRWNAAGLLQEVERPDGLRAEFSYDAFARRVTKKVTRAGTTRSDRLAVSETRFVWDQAVLVHEIEVQAEVRGDPIIQERTYWFDDRGFAPMAHQERRVNDADRESARWFHYVNDPIGTPERLLSSNGAVACELVRSAFGRTVQATGGQASTRIRFAGQYEDDETGLRYNRFRYYDAETGRFVSADPIDVRGGLNVFSYVRSPIAHFDPLGLADPGLPELVAAFQAAYPGRPFQTNHTQTHSDGRELEIDFETDNCIIEVKGGNGKGLGRQVTDRQDCSVNPEGKPVIGYSGDEIGKHARREVNSRGGIAADHRDMATLMAAIAPDPPKAGGGT